MIFRPSKPSLMSAVGREVFWPPSSPAIAGQRAMSQQRRGQGQDGALCPCRAHQPLGSVTQPGDLGRNQ
jgi:hypothetical protein